MKMKNKVCVVLAGSEFQLEFDMESLMTFEEISGVGLTYVQAAMMLALGDDNLTSSQKMMEFGKYFKSNWSVCAVYAGLLNTEKSMTMAECQNLCFEHGTGQLPAVFMSVFPAMTGRIETKNDDAAEGPKDKSEK